MAETPDPKITKTAARRFAVLQKEQLYGEGKGNGAILVKFGKGREGKGRAEAACTLARHAQTPIHSSPRVTTPTSYEQSVSAA